ncbi:hypothetical protein [Stakelama sediminis]
MVIATRSDAAPDALWYMRLWLEHHKGDDAAAVATVEAMSSGRGRALNAIPRPLLFDLDTALKKAGNTALRIRLLKVLSADSYIPDDTVLPPDAFKQRYATLLFAQGQKDEARAVVKSIREPAIVRDMLFEPGLRTLFGPDYDFRALVERRNAALKRIAQEHPDLLEPVVIRSVYLQILGKPQEALQILNAARAKIDVPNHYSDAQHQVIWFWNEWASAETMLGKYDDAVAAFRQATSKQEDGGANVSQVINLAATQLQFAHPEAALSTLKAFDDDSRSTSPFGEMQFREVRGCANSRLGHADKANSDLEYLQQHEADAPAALTDMLICMDDVDSAAASYIRRLQNPEQQAGALIELSDFADPPVQLPSYPGQKVLKQLKARADVRAAAAQAGGIRHLNVQDVSY